MHNPPRTTFFNAPATNATPATNVAPTPGALPIVGVPFDALSTERGGSAEAPETLRRASQHVGRYRVSTGCVIDWAQRCVDLGDLPVNRFDPVSGFEPVRQVVERCLADDGPILLVGGDHSLTYPAVTAAVSHHRPLRLVQIDAHHDATDPARWHCRYNHGTFIRNLIDDGCIAGRDVFQIGIRDFQWHESGAAFVAEHGVNVLPMHEIDRVGFAGILEQLRATPEQPTYVTFDIDSVDPAHAPGTGEHMPGGFSAREALALVRELFDGRLNIVAADLVEVVPSLDATGRTAALASQLLALMADGLARQVRHADASTATTVIAQAHGKETP